MPFQTGLLRIATRTICYARVGHDYFFPELNRTNLSQSIKSFRLSFLFNVAQTDLFNY